ncbi:hypothetical protein [Paenibacillus favisporus]|uniref:hypothetical protein n=1 Tax=Paenibacillus favisporus TaxID=221028 RepID=UPI0013D6626C|nr:hypothetical protein [Paenibacillus favisporus]
MLKSEVIKQTKDMGIVLSESTFNRYYQHGLIVSDKSGLGYSRGVMTQYHERTLDAIVLIDKLKSSKMYRHQKDYIFILYWKGFPIQWDKLKARLIESHTEVINNFKVIADFTDNPDFIVTIDDLVAEEVAKSPKEIGRPSKHSIEKQKIEARESAKRYILISRLISGILNNGAISQDVFHSFNHQNALESTFMDGSLLDHVNNWLQKRTWRDAVKHSEELDYQETYKLITLLKDYWADLVRNFGDFYDIPIIRSFQQKAGTDSQLKFFSDRPWIYKFVILVLICGGFRKQLIEILTTPENRNSCKCFIASIPSLLTNTSGKEVTVNG